MATIFLIVKYLSYNGLWVTVVFCHTINISQDTEMLQSDISKQFSLLQGYLAQAYACAGLCKFRLRGVLYLDTCFNNYARYFQMTMDHDAFFQALRLATEFGKHEPWYLFFTII